MAHDHESLRQLDCYALHALQTARFPRACYPLFIFDDPFRCSPPLSVQFAQQLPFLLGVLLAHRHGAAPACNLAFFHLPVTFASSDERAVSAYWDLGYDVVYAIDGDAS